MRNLKEIYESGVDIRESEVPEIWKESFHNFMIGSAHIADYNEDGSIKEFVYYSIDFRAWYRQNKKAIERDIKVDDIIKKS